MDRDISRMMILKTSESSDLANRVYDEITKRLKPQGYEIPQVGNIAVSYFNNLEADIQVKDNIRRKHVFIFHDFNGYEGACDPNIGFMKLYLIDEALQSGSPNEITYVLTNIPYLRQDRRDKHRKPISAKRVLKMLKDPESTIHTRLLTFDMHAKQIEGFVGYPVDELMALPLFLGYFKSVDPNFGIFDPNTPNFLDLSRYAVVSPDAGGVERVKTFSNHIGAPVSIALKHRPGPGQVEKVYILDKERAAGKEPIIIDDIGDTLGTVLKIVDNLRSVTDKKVHACLTHWIGSPARNKDGTIKYYPEDKLREYGINLITTDTIPRSPEYVKMHEGCITFLSIAPMLSEAICSICTGDSVSELNELK
jgi:ribose-phosphate pyrophosphokinase